MKKKCTCYSAPDYHREECHLYKSTILNEISSLKRHRNFFKECQELFYNKEQFKIVMKLFGETNPKIANKDYWDVYYEYFKEIRRY